MMGSAWGGKGSCDFAGAMSSQYGPVDIGAQVFAPDRALGDLLYLRAPFGWDRAQALQPLVNCWRGHPDGLGQPDLSAEIVAGFFDCVHLANFSPAIVSGQ